MKKFLALFLAITMLLCLASCGSKKKTTSGDDTGVITDTGDAAETTGTDTEEATGTDTAEEKEPAKGPEIDVIEEIVTTDSNGKYVKPEPKAADVVDPDGLSTYEAGHPYSTDIAIANDDGNFVVEPKNDEQTITWTVGNITHVVTHDGKEILSYTTYMDYFDEKAAEEAYLQTVEAGPEMGDYICLLARKGTFVIIGYEGWGIPFKTPAEAQAAADAAAELTADK